MQFQEMQCPVCQGSKPKLIKFAASFNEQKISPRLFEARNSEHKMHFRIMECAGCKMWISDPTLDPESLHQMYEHAEHHYEELEKYIALPYKRLLRRALRATTSRTRFVDVGGGNGFVLDLPLLQGFNERIEVELSKSAEKEFKMLKRDGTFIRGTLAPGLFPSNSIAIASCFHILDHLSDPLHFLRLLFDFLEPGGAATCVVHNTQALSAKVLGKHTPILGVWHTYLYNPANIKRLFRMAGFSSVRVAPVLNTYPVWYWADSLPLKSTTKRKQRRLLSRLGVANLPFAAYAGNLSVIAFKGPSASTRDAGECQHMKS